MANHLNCDCCDYDCGQYPETSSNSMNDLNDKFLKKKTFEDRFEVIWNFIAETGPMRHCDNITMKKTVASSTHWRKVGNSEYTSTKKNYLTKSIEAYTKSIAYGLAGSTELSLAYANRSAVLFKARLYDDCLVDIERALTSGYPDDLKTKLYVRQALCIKALNPDFDFETSDSMANAMKWLSNLKIKYPNYNIKNQYLKMFNELDKPCDTNMIKFTPIIDNYSSIIVGGSDAIELKKTDENNQQHIVATRNIKSGEFIYINKPFEIIVCNDKRYTNCWNCCRQTWSGVPCDYCPNVIFCSFKCKDTAWKEYHDFECPILSLSLKVEMDVEDDWRFQLTNRILSKAVKAAGGIVELKKKIDNVDLNVDKSMIYTDDKFDVNTWDNFHRLDYYKPTSNKCSLSRGLRISSIVAMFGLDTTIFGKKMSLFEVASHKHSIILGGLIFRYIMIVDRNVVFYTDRVPKDVKLTHAVIAPILEMFVKNCDPHVNWYNCEPNFTILTERPIKKGEKILFSSVGRYQDKSFIKRKIEFALFNDKPCKCFACEHKLPLMDNLPSYKNLKLSKQVQNELKRIMRKSNGYFELLGEGNTEKLLKIKNNLIQMIDKFYQHVTVPCKEASLFPLMLGALIHQLGTPRRIIQ